LFFFGTVFFSCWEEENIFSPDPRFQVDLRCLQANRQSVSHEQVVVHTLVGRSLPRGAHNDGDAIRRAAVITVAARALSEPRSSQSHESEPPGRHRQYLTRALPQKQKEKKRLVRQQRLIDSKEVLNCSAPRK
jgi:hypothetical protein